MAKAKDVEKVGGKFKADSEIGRMFTFLSDGKSHSKDDTIKAVKPKTGRIINKTKRLAEWGKKSGNYTLAVAEDGALQMTTHKKSTAKKSTKPASKTAE